MMPQICYDASLQEQAKQGLAEKEHLLTQTALIFSQNGKKLYERQDKQTVLGMLCVLKLPAVGKCYFKIYFPEIIAIKSRSVQFIMVLD